ncbi:MAG: hypothetical protein WEC59_02395 [Salibacteraceae bacterium]
MSETENKAREKRITELIGDLKSRNERKIIGALNRIPHEGNSKMIEPLFDLYLQNQSHEVIMLLEKTIHNLKDPACVAPMVGILSNQEKKELHQNVLNAAWQSGLELTDHLNLLIDVAIMGDYMTAVEVMTVVENQEFVDDDAITDAIKVMDKVVEKKNDKQSLMVTLRQILLDKLLGQS